MLFVSRDYDFVPYTPRLHGQLHECINNKGWTVQQITEFEVELRKEVSLNFTFDLTQIYGLYDV